jgi:hypothetical protein
MNGPAVVCAIVVDCEDASRVAGFWQTMLGGRVVSYPEYGLEALRAPGITFDFVSNGYRKSSKNRWHLDLATDDAAETVAVALAAGATRAADFAETDDFVVMRDPEGNEFCVLRSAPAAVPWAPPPTAKE